MPLKFYCHNSQSQSEYEKFFEKNISFVFNTTVRLIGTFLSFNGLFEKVCSKKIHDAFNSGKFKSMLVRISKKI